MLVSLDGSKISDFKSFLGELSATLADAEQPVYFGWELHSLGDCLQGGYVGNPPYDIEVRNAERMIAAFGHAGMSSYCTAMLRVIDGGGRGLVQEESREWLAAAQRSADREEGPTLLDALFDVFRAAPATIRLISADGRELGSATGRV